MRLCGYSAESVFEAGLRASGNTLVLPQWKPNVEKADALLQQSNGTDEAQM